VVSTLLAQWEDHVRRGIEAMQADGLIDRGIDAGQHAAALIAGIQGGVQVLRSTGAGRHLEAALDLGIDRLRHTPTHTEGGRRIPWDPPALLVRLRRGGQGRPSCGVICTVGSAGPA
jgi:hypothetical protein